MSAEALFSTFTNLHTIDGHTYSGIEIQIANPQTITGGEGQAISGITFSLGNSLQHSGISLVQDQGPEVTVQKQGPIVTGPNTVTGTQSTFSGNYQQSPPDPFFHWGSSTSTSAVTLQTVGNAAQGGKPNHLIIGASSNGSYDSSYNEHDPEFFSPNLGQATTFWIGNWLAPSVALSD